MTLYLVGSGPADTLDAIHDQFVAQAKRFGTRIAIFELGTPDEVGEYLPAYTAPIATRWPEAVLEPVYLDDDGETVWPDDIEQLAGLIVAGGWTPGYLDALLPIRDTIAKLVRGGVPYLGFSAGAMIVSKHAIVGGWKHRGRVIAPEQSGEGFEELTVREGLGLIGPSIETHTDAWTNIGVPMTAVEFGHVASAVAIDEGTCLIVDTTSGRTSVHGPGKVHWVSRDGAAVSVRSEAAPPAEGHHDQHAPKPSDLHPKPHPAPPPPPGHPEPPAPPEPENAAPATEEPDEEPLQAEVVPDEEASAPAEPPEEPADPKE